MLQAVGEVLFEVFCVLTGRGILWAITRGRWKAFDGNDSLATAVGLAFWGSAGIFAVLLFVW